MDSFFNSLGIKTGDKNFIDPANSFLIKETIRRGEGKLAESGALVVNTGKHTGRSAEDKYVVKSETTKDKIWWENSINEMTIEQFNSLKKDVVDYLNTQERLYITDRSVGASAENNIGVRLISSNPSHALFSKHLFRKKMREFEDQKDFTILHAPTMEIDPSKYGAKNPTIITTCFDTNTTIIVGTLYAGEIKKSMFCILNYALPDKGIMPMHAGASRLDNEEVSVFFGLSGTGKTTLSTDEGTFLIGDDEHGMGPEGVFNFEGGCYAKTYKLSKETEPEIYEASTRFGSLLENVKLHDPTGRVDFFDKSITENGRSSYPLEAIKERDEDSNGDVPKHIFFLSADAFGVLPPVAKLTREQALFYFVLGYTAKLAGTEIGIKEPVATFSPCFGAPFMLQHPSVYANLLGKYLEQYNINVWLINTGWTGGAFGVGHRFPLATTRQIIRSIQANKLNDVATEKDEIFGLQIPVNVPDIADSLLKPEKSWDNKEDFQAKAKDLAKSFHAQMKEFGTFYDQNIQGAPLYNS